MAHNVLAGVSRSSRPRTKHDRDQSVAKNARSRSVLLTRLPEAAGDFPHPGRGHAFGTGAAPAWAAVEN